MATRRDSEAPDLKAETIAILLHGWAAHAPEPSAHGFGGGLLELYDADGPATLWRLHERHLRTTAARWGWEPSWRMPDGTLGFYGEYCAATGKE